MIHWILSCAAIGNLRTAFRQSAAATTHLETNHTTMYKLTKLSKIPHKTKGDEIECNGLLITWSEGHSERCTLNGIKRSSKFHSNWVTLVLVGQLHPIQS